MSLIKTHNISKKYKMGEVEVTALQDVSLDIESGEFVVILGPSGSGKSTLLNIIGGMDKPDAGEIYFLDEKLNDMREKALTNYRRFNVGFVFQFYNLMANLTAYENVEIATEISTNPLLVDEVIANVGLSERKDHFPSQMSGGEQQRVAIARAVAKNPSILLCDEPTGALDSKTGKEVLKVLKKVNSDYHKTVVIITHNAAIGETADRVIKLRNGMVVDDYRNAHPVSIDEVEW
jgi:putative ABC transport system ATP-binding protein